VGFSVSAAFAILVIGALVSFGLLYTTFENSYTSIQGASYYHQRQLIEQQNAKLELSSYSYNTSSLVALYDVTFNLTNRGTTLEPGKWSFIYDGIYDNTSVTVQNLTYLFPGASITVTVQDVPKNASVQSLVINTEVGCSLMIKWIWNGTTNSPQVLNTAWYCPVGG